MLLFPGVCPCQIPDAIKTGPQLALTGFGSQSQQSQGVSGKLARALQQTKAICQCLVKSQ
jgi:hypothetical protein